MNDEAAQPRQRPGGRNGPPLSTSSGGVTGACTLTRAPVSETGPPAHTGEIRFILEST